MCVHSFFIHLHKWGEAKKAENNKRFRPFSGCVIHFQLFCWK